MVIIICPDDFFVDRLISLKTIIFEREFQKTDKHLVHQPFCHAIIIMPQQRHFPF